VPKFGGWKCVEGYVENNIFQLNTETYYPLKGENAIGVVSP